MKGPFDCVAHFMCGCSALSWMCWLCGFSPTDCSHQRDITEMLDKSMLDGWVNEWTMMEAVVATRNASQCSKR